jgi:hypothetical protein
VVTCISKENRLKQEIINIYQELIEAAKLEYSHRFLILFLIIIISFIAFWEIPEFRFMLTGRIAQTAGTTANVTVYGKLGNVTVYFNPVNYTPSGSEGIAPGSFYPKVDAGGVGYIRINLTADNNMAWNIFMNATELSDGAGHTIPVNAVQVNSSCDGNPSSLQSLSNGFVDVCSENQGTPNDIEPHESADVYFWLNLPAGQYNATYSGHLWIYINHTGTDPAGDNRTWYGPYNITVTVSKTIDLIWSLVPINFGSMAPGSSSNATDNQGFPTNITSTAVTNVFIDLYINGTNLVEQIDPTKIIGVGNISYSNATQLSQWPSSIKDLDINFPASTFGNWEHVGNATHTYSYWNITIPVAQPGGVYGGNVYAKAVEEGENP